MTTRRGKSLNKESDYYFGHTRCRSTDYIAIEPQSPPLVRPLEKSTQDNTQLRVQNRWANSENNDEYARRGGYVKIEAIYSMDWRNATSWRSRPVMTSLSMKAVLARVSSRQNYKPIQSRLEFPRPPLSMAGAPIILTPPRELLVPEQKQQDVIVPQTESPSEPKETSTAPNVKPKHKWDRLMGNGHMMRRTLSARRQKVIHQPRHVQVY